MLKPFVKLIQALSSNTAPSQIAHAFSCGILLGFLPKDNILWYLLFVFMLFMRLQRGLFALSIIVGSLLTALLDPTFDSVGTAILTNEALIPYFVKLLNIPFVAFTKFNNTIVMGSLFCGIIMYIPCYVFARIFTLLWRKYMATYVRKIKFLTAIKQVPGIKKIIELVEDM